MLRTCSSDPLLYAFVEGDTIYCNPSYAVQIDDEHADKEHKLGCILLAVTLSRHPDDAVAAVKYTAQLRMELAAAERLR